MPQDHPVTVDNKLVEVNLQVFMVVTAPSSLTTGVILAKLKMLCLLRQDILLLVGTTRRSEEAMVRSMTETEAAAEVEWLNQAVTASLAVNLATSHSNVQARTATGPQGEL